MAMAVVVRGMVAAMELSHLNANPRELRNVLADRVMSMFERRSSTPLYIIHDGFTTTYIDRIGMSQLPETGSTIFHCWCDWSRGHFISTLSNTTTSDITDSNKSKR